MDVKTVIWGFNEEQLEEIVNRDTNVWTMNACLFSLKPYQWYIHWVQKKIFTKCTNTDTEGGMIKGSFEGERERELEIKSCVGDRIWKWGITQCFFKRMRKYYMKTRVKEMHIGKLDKEFNTYYEKKGRNTCSLNDESLRDIMTRQFQRKLTLCLYIYIYWWAFPFLLRWLTTSRSLHQINICHRV